MNELDWEALRLFAVVARAGSLSGAAELTGVSAPTLGRHMATLEKTLGRKIFIRTQRGYELAADGMELLERVRSMEDAAGDISAWSSGVYRIPVVTISAGTWVSRFLAQNLAQLWAPEDSFRVCFQTSEARVHLEHREADIGLRNARPHAGNLAVRKAVQVAFAPYCRHDFDTGRHDNWVSIGRETGGTPSSRWVHSQPELWITSWVSTPLMLLDMVRAGAGRGVLPCFIADDDPLLRRAGPRIDALEHTMWIVMHDDERRRTEKRLVIERLSSLLDANARLFAGGTGT